jgi:hypothetical protein
MSKKSEGSSRTSRTRVSRGRTKAAQKKVERAEQNELNSSPASERFRKDLLVRGEAAKPDRKGKLPPDATHAITRKKKDGTVEVKRARFKYF